MKNTDRSWTNLIEAFHRDGVLHFSSGLAMDVRRPIEWPEPFPQVSRTMIARDLCYFIDHMRMGGFEFLPADAVTSTERAAGAAFFTEALTRFAIGEIETRQPSAQTDWHFGAILIGATQFVAKVETDAHRVIARSETPASGTAPEVMSVLGEFIAFDRERYEIEARGLSALAAQGDQTSRTIQ